MNSLLHANNGDVLREAAIAGMGVILQPDFLLEDALADGRLVRVLPEWEAAPIGIFAVYTSRSHRHRRCAVSSTIWWKPGCRVRPPGMARRYRLMDPPMFPADMAR